MIFGYARAGILNQQLHSQVDALQAYGCTEVAQEESASWKTRPALQHLLARLRNGDTLVVWKLDRLGCLLNDLIPLIAGFQQREVRFISLHDHLDTATSQKYCVFNIFASLAESEWAIMHERLVTGRIGHERPGWRPKGLSKENFSKAQAVKALYLQGKTVDEISLLLGMGCPTIYRYLLYLNGPS